ERPEYPGLVAALMFEAMWLIGLRSVECLQCALMLKVDGGFRTVEDLLETVSPPPPKPGLTLQQIQEKAIDHALEEILGGNSEPVLFVITAKSASTRRKGLPVIRQIHVGGLSFASKQNLFYLSMLRGMGLAGREMANFMRDMRYRIRRASEKVLGRGEFVTPHDA